MYAIAVVGSRSYRNLAAVRAFVDMLSTDTVLVSGGARGVDKTAERHAASRGMRVVSIPPDFKVHGRRAPLVRNEQIVERADWVVAFWDGKSAGTLHTMSIARRMKKPLIVMPDTERTPEAP
jgi:predicted Rossmann fold nucleotide-binding protein DprA/Smf involved in DNA uptake